VATFFPVSPFIAVPGKPLCNQCINKCADLISGFFRHAFGKAADLIKETIYGVLPVQELPQVYARRAQAKAMTGIGVEENGPVVKLLPEHDVRVGYGFFAAMGHKRLAATYVPRAHDHVHAWRLDVLRKPLLTHHLPYLVPSGLSLHAEASFTISSFIAPSDRSIAFL
jgi:hypothetical protein